MSTDFRIYRCLSKSRTDLFAWRCIVLMEGNFKVLEISVETIKDINDQPYYLFCFTANAAIDVLKYNLQNEGFELMSHSITSRQLSYSSIKQITTQASVCIQSNSKKQKTGAYSPEHSKEESHCDNSMDPTIVLASTITKSNINLSGLLLEVKRLTMSLKVYGSNGKIDHFVFVGLKYENCQIFIQDYFLRNQYFFEENVELDESFDDHLKFIFSTFQLTENHFTLQRTNYNNSYFGIEWLYHWSFHFPKEDSFFQSAVSNLLQNSILIDYKIPIPKPIFRTKSLL